MKIFTFSFVCSVRSPNDLLYYPGLPIPNPQHELIKNQQGVITPAATARFTAPPQGLVDAIYAWFAENNLPVPEGPSKNGKGISTLKKKIVASNLYHYRNFKRAGRQVQ